MEHQTSAQPIRYQSLLHTLVAEHQARLAEGAEAVTTPTKPQMRTETTLEAAMTTSTKQNATNFSEDGIPYVTRLSKFMNTGETD